MRKLCAMAIGFAAAVGFGFAISSPAQAEPFETCPYNPNGGVQAWQQWYDGKLAEAAALDQEYRAKLPTLSGGERMAYAESVLAQAKRMEAERSNIPAACTPLQPVADAPYFNPAPLAPMPETPLIVDGVAPQQSGVDCTKLRQAYNDMGPVVNIGDAVARLNKIPGLSQVQGTSLALCGIDAVPNAIGNPNQQNQQRVFDGACGAVGQFTNGLIDLCGDTPVR